MKAKTSILIATAMLVTACTTTAKEGYGTSPSQVYDTRAFLFSTASDCVATGKQREIVGIAALATILAPLLETAVKEGVKLLGNALDDAAKSKETSVSAIANEHFYRKITDSETRAPGFVPAQRCLVIVRGKFGPTSDQTVFAGGWNRGDRSKLAKKIGLAAAPDLYLELAFRASDDITAMKFRLGRLEYRAALLKGLKETRDLAIAVVLQSPQKKSEKNEQEAFAIGGMSVENVVVGSKLGVEALRGKETAWLPMLPLTKERTQSLPSLRDNAKIAPFSAFVTVTETRDGSKFLQFLAGVFKAQEETISTGAAKIIIDLSGLKKKK